jgi:hypothetical protein
MARPPKYTPEELAAAVDDYLDQKLNNDKKINFVSIVDLCLFLDIDKQTFYNYKNKPSYSTAIKKAENAIISIWEQQLFLPGRNTTGAIFYLKNFGGMADRVEHQHQVSGSIDHNKVDKLEELDDKTLQQLSKAVDMIEQRQNAVDVDDIEEE